MARNLYEVVFSGRFQNQAWINRFNYVSNDVSSNVQGSLALARLLVGGDILPGFPGFQLAPTSLVSRLLTPTHGSNAMTGMSVINVYNDVDFFSTPISPAFNGSLGGAAASPALTYKFRSNVVRRDIRPGQKAIGGLSEDSMAAGGAIEGDRFAELNALAQTMSEILQTQVGGVTVSFSPCIVSKEKYDVPNSGTPPRKAYRYYEDDPTTQLENIAEGVTWSVVDTVRTQVSRQYGRGI